MAYRRLQNDRFVDDATGIVYEDRPGIGLVAVGDASGAARVSIVNPSGALLGSGSFEVISDTTLSAPAAQINITGLTGSTAYIYRITGYFLFSAVSLPTLQLNGSSAAAYDVLNVRMTAAYAGSALSNQTNFPLMSGASFAAGEGAIFTIDVFSDNVQLHTIKSEMYTNIGTSGEIHLATGEWDATSATQITSILLDGGIVGTGRFGAGTRYQVSRMALAQ